MTVNSRPFAFTVGAEKTWLGLGAPPMGMMLIEFIGVFLSHDQPGDGKFTLSTRCHVMATGSQGSSPLPGGCVVGTMIKLPLRTRSLYWPLGFCLNLTLTFISK